MPGPRSIWNSQFLNRVKKQVSRGPDPEAPPSSLLPQHQGFWVLLCPVWNSGFSVFDCEEQGVNLFNSFPISTWGVLLLPQSLNRLSYWPNSAKSCWPQSLSQSQTLRFREEHSKGKECLQEKKVPHWQNEAIRIKYPAFQGHACLQPYQVPWRPPTLTCFNCFVTILFLVSWIIQASMQTYCQH